MATTVGQHQVGAISDPADGSLMVASTMRSVSTTLRTGINDHDNDSGVHLQSGTSGSRPAAGTSGRKWLDTDTLFIKYDNGVSWDDLNYLKLSGGTVTGAVTLSNTLGGLTGLTMASGTASLTGTINLIGGVTVTTAKTTLAATANGYASLNLPHGTAPASPVNGDVWTTTAGMYVRTNGATVGPLVSQATYSFAPSAYYYSNAASTYSTAYTSPNYAKLTLPDTGAASNATVASDVVTVNGTTGFCLVSAFIESDNTGDIGNVSMKIYVDGSGTNAYTIENVGAYGATSPLTLTAAVWLASGSTISVYAKASGNGTITLQRLDIVRIG